MHWQAPAAQEKPVGQAWPQAPQLAALVWRFWQPAGVWQQVLPAAQAAPPLHVHRLLALHASLGLQATRLPLQVQRPVPLQIALPAPGREHCPLVEQPQMFLGRAAPSQTNGPLPLTSP